MAALYPALIWPVLVLIVIVLLLAVFGRNIKGLLETRRTRQVLANEATALANRERQYELDRKAATAKETDELNRAQLQQERADAKAQAAADSQTINTRRAAREKVITARADAEAKVARQEALTANDAAVMRALSKAYQAYSRRHPDNWQAWLGSYDPRGRDSRHVSAQAEAYITYVQSHPQGWGDWIGRP